MTLTPVEGGTLLSIVIIFPDAENARHGRARHRHGRRDGDQLRRMESTVLSA